MRKISIDWCINCAYKYAGNNIKKRMFADIFIRITKNLPYPDMYIVEEKDKEFVLDSRFYNDCIKDTVCIEDLWFKKSYWKFFVGMIRESYSEQNLYSRQCKINISKTGGIIFKF